MTDNHLLLPVLGLLGLAGILIFSLIIRRRMRRPSSSNPYMEALKLLTAGEKDGAFKQLEKAVRQGGAPPDAYLRLGRLLRERGFTGKALQMHKSLTVNTALSQREKADLILDLAEDYERMGKPDKAIRVLESASNLGDTKSTDILFTLGRLYNKANESEKAYEVMKDLKKKGVLDDGRLALFLTTQAERYIQEGNAKEASKLLGRALKHDDGCTAALVYSGDLEFASGNIDNAMQKWKKAALTAKDAALYALDKLERTLFERGKFSDIERIYREIIDKRADDENATLSLARFYVKQGKHDEALELLKEYSTWHPKSIKSLLLLFSILAKKADVDAIERLVKDSLSRFSTEHTYKCTICGFHSDTIRQHCPICNSFYTFSSSHDSEAL